MGVVYKAEQQKPRREVALKIIRGRHHADEFHIKMFHREAASLGRLRHPNIAAIYESGHTTDGRHCFAMELVRGATLDVFCRQVDGLDGKKPAAERLSPTVPIPGSVRPELQRRWPVPTSSSVCGFF